jgi:hypothetical protein
MALADVKKLNVASVTDGHEGGLNAYQEIMDKYKTSNIMSVKKIQTADGMTNLTIPSFYSINDDISTWTGDDLTWLNSLPLGTKWTVYVTGATPNVKKFIKLTDINATGTFATNFKQFQVA